MCIIYFYIGVVIIIIPAKARDYVLPALVCLSVCLFVCLCLQCFDAVGWAAGRASGL